MRLDALHFFANCHHLVDIHRVLGQRTFFQQFSKRIAVDGAIHHLIEFGTRFRRIAVANRFNEQFTQASIVKCHLAQNIEYLTAKRISFFFQLFKQSLIYCAFSCFLGNQIPEITNLRLSNSMDTAKTLLKPIRVPWQIIIDHQMRTLQVDAFACRIGRNQDAYILVLLK